MAPPPLHDFSDCSRTHMDGASPLADFFALESCASLKKKKKKIGPIVTRSRDLLSLHVSPKIAHFCDLCTKHMEMSFFLKNRSNIGYWVLFKVYVVVVGVKIVDL